MAMISYKNKKGQLVIRSSPKCPECNEGVIITEHGDLVCNKCYAVFTTYEIMKLIGEED